MERMGIKYSDKEFKEGIRGFQEMYTGMKPLGVEFGGNVILRISLRKGSTVELLNMGLNAAFIEANNSWRNREQVGGG